MGHTLRSYCTVMYKLFYVYILILASEMCQRVVLIGDTGSSHLERPDVC